MRRWSSERREVLLLLGAAGRRMAAVMLAVTVASGLFPPLIVVLSGWLAGSLQAAPSSPPARLLAVVALVALLAALIADQFSLSALSFFMQLGQRRIDGVLRRPMAWARFSSRPCRLIRHRLFSSFSLLVTTPY